MSQLINPETGQPVQQNDDGSFSSVNNNQVQGDQSQDSQQEPVAQAPETIPAASMQGIGAFLNTFYKIAEQVRNTPATQRLNQINQYMLSEQYLNPDPLIGERAKQLEAYHAQARIDALRPHLMERAVGVAPISKEQEMPGLMQKAQAYRQQIDNLTQQQKFLEERAVGQTRDLEDYFLSDSWSNQVKSLKREYGVDIGDQLSKLEDIALAKAGTGTNIDLQKMLSGLIRARDQKPESISKFNFDTNQFEDIPLEDNPADVYIQNLAKRVSLDASRLQEDFASRKQKYLLDPVFKRLQELAGQKTEDEQINEQANAAAEAMMTREDARTKAGLDILKGQADAEQQLADKQIIGNKNFSALVASVAENEAQQNGEIPASDEQTSQAAVPEELQNLINPETGQPMAAPGNQLQSPSPPAAPNAQAAPLNNPPPSKPPASTPLPKEGLLGNQNSIPAFAQGAWNEAVDLGRGIGEASYEAGNKLGLVSDQRLQEVYDTVKEQRKSAAQALKEKYGDYNNFAVGAGKLAADLSASLLPGNVAVKGLEAIPKIGQLGGILGLALKGAAGGAGAGAALGMATPTGGDASRLDNALEGAKSGAEFGLGGGVVLGTLGKAINALRPSIRAATKAQEVTGPLTDDVMRMSKTADDVGTFAEPTALTGSSVAKTTEAESALNKVGLKDVEGKLAGREKALLNKIKEYVADIRNPNEGKQAKALYEQVLPQEVPQEIQQKILSNPLLRKAYEEMHASGNYDMRGIKIGTFADFDKLKRVIDSKVQRDVFSAGYKETEAAKDLNYALDGNPVSGDKGLRQILDDVNPQYSQARQLSERGMIQKEMLQAIKEAKIKSSTGEADIFNLYDNLFDTAAKRDYFVGKLNRAGVDTSNINNLLDFVGNIRKSGLYNLTGRQSLKTGRLENAGGVTGTAWASARNFVMGKYNKAFIDLITSPRWEEQVARINAAKNEMARLKMLNNTLARIAGVEGAKPDAEQQ